MHTRVVRGRHLARPGGALLVPAAAFSVHQLRYSLAYGSKANAELAAQGHSYLHSLVPWVVLTLALALSTFLRRVARAFRSGDAGRSPRVSAAVLWPLATAGLLGVYVVQESLEALLASGHPGGVAGIVGHGGWWAVPAAAALAAAVVALLRIGRLVLRLVARGARRRRAPAATAPWPSFFVLVARGPLAHCAAGRAPPLTA